MNLTYLILKLSIFGVQFMIGTFLTPSPNRGGRPNPQGTARCLNSNFFEQIRKFQILCDALEFLSLTSICYTKIIEIMPSKLFSIYFLYCPHFSNDHWDRCTVQGVWMAHLVPNETLLDFNELHQDHRAYVKQVIQYVLLILFVFCKQSLGQVYLSRSLDG